MQNVLINGNLKLNSGHLESENQKTKEKQIFSLFNLPNNIIIDTNKGYISYQAITLAMFRKIGITFLNDGVIIGQLMPYESDATRLEKQFEFYYDKAKRLNIARNIENVKLQRQIELLQYFNQVYDFDFPKFANFNVDSIRKLLGIEGQNALAYFDVIREITAPFPISFNTRMSQYGNRENNANDYANALLNYLYKLLYVKISRSIALSGLNCHIGYIHTIAKNKTPLIYDMQEMFRFLCDKIMIESLENRIFSVKDFYRSYEYVVRLRPEATLKAINLFNLELSQNVKYKGLNYKWESIIDMKVIEFAKTFKVDAKPEFVLERKDNKALRKEILNTKLTGKNKSSVWYRQQRIKQGLPLKIYKKRK